MLVPNAYDPIDPDFRPTHKVRGRQDPMNGEDPDYTQTENNTNHGSNSPSNPSSQNLPKANKPAQKPAQKPAYTPREPSQPARPVMSLSEGFGFLATSANINEAVQRIRLYLQTIKRSFCRGRCFGSSDNDFQSLTC